MPIVDQGTIWVKYALSLKMMPAGAILPIQIHVPHAIIHIWPREKEINNIHSILPISLQYRAPVNINPTLLTCGETEAERR
jgi:nitrate reductase beta subunit